MLHSNGIQTVNEIEGEMSNLAKQKQSKQTNGKQELMLQTKLTKLVQQADKPQSIISYFNDKDIT